MTVVVLHKHRQGKTFTQTTLSDNETGHVESFSDIIFKIQISSYAIFHQLKLLIKKKKNRSYKIESPTTLQRTQRISMWWGILLINYIYFLN